MAYECQAVPAAEGSGANIRTVREKMLGNLVKDGLQLSRRMKKRDNVYNSQGPINEWDLVDCRDLFPRWDG